MTITISPAHDIELSDGSTATISAHMIRFWGRCPKYFTLAHVAATPIPDLEVSEREQWGITCNACGTQITDTCEEEVR